MFCFISKIPNRYGALNIFKGYGSGWVIHMVKAMSMVVMVLLVWLMLVLYLNPNQITLSIFRAPRLFGHILKKKRHANHERYSEL